MPEDLHNYANSTLPDSVKIPPTWQGLALWALGKWGVGAVFMGMVFFLYSDLRESNKQFADLVRSNIAAFTVLSARVDDSHGRVGTMSETIRRIESGIQNLQTSK